MPFTSKEFLIKMEELEKKHHDWFSRHPPLNSDSSVNSINDHYYIYMSGAGYQLRFNVTSDLPLEIRNEIKAEFEKYNHS